MDGLDFGTDGSCSSVWRYGWYNYIPRFYLQVPTRKVTNILSNSATSFAPHHRALSITSCVYAFPTPTPTASSTRDNLGPLTTIFTPPPTCRDCLIASSIKYPEVCRQYYTDCHDDPRPCLPDNHTWERFAMYSPGLACPSGWTTATVVSAEMTYSFSARDVIGRLEKGETAAFCCPA